MIELTGFLFEIQAEIKAAQAKTSGAVCLELYGCGDNCLGCPHPRWVQYYWSPDRPGRDGILKCINLDKADKDPARLIPRKGKNADELRALIAEAKEIIEERAALIAALRTLRPYARRNDALAKGRAAREAAAAQAKAPAPVVPAKAPEAVPAPTPVAQETASPAAAPVSTVTKWALAASATADAQPQITSTRRRAIRS